MSMRSYCILVVTGAALLSACDSSPNPDDDAGEDGSMTMDSTVEMDAGIDAAPDSGVDAGDSGTDAAMEGGTDAGTLPVDFYTSFETTDMPLTWVNSPEPAGNDVKSFGVTEPVLVLGNVTSEVMTSASTGSSPANEAVDRLLDSQVGTKWLVFQNNAIITYTFAAPIVVRRYSIITANDAPTRDPRNWTVEGSTNGTSWTVLDTQAGRSFTNRFQQLTLDFANETAYTYYRMNITQNNGDSRTQLAELALSSGSMRWAASSRAAMIFGSTAS